MREPQGVASLALGYVLLPFQGASSAAVQQFKQAWLHSPCTMIQPALAKSETSVKKLYSTIPINIVDS